MLNSKHANKIFTEDEDDFTLPETTNSNFQFTRPQSTNASPAKGLSPEKSSTNTSPKGVISAPFQQALDNIFKLHSDELAEQKEGFDKATAQWQRRNDELLAQNTKLRKENMKLQTDLSKIQEQLENYKERCVQLETKLKHLNSPVQEEDKKSDPDMSNEDKKFLDLVFPNQSKTKKRKSTEANTEDVPTVVTTVHNETSKDEKKPLESIDLTVSGEDEKQKDDSGKAGSFSQYSVVDVDDDTVHHDEEDNMFKTLADKKMRKGTFKYVEPVKKKADRALLPGVECEHCRKWYDALNEGGLMKDRKKFVNDCSRHRHLFEAPDTPPDFWHLSFPDSETQDHQ